MSVCVDSADPPRTVLGELLWVAGDYDAVLADLDRLEEYFGDGDPKNQYIRYNHPRFAVVRMFGTSCFELGTGFLPEVLRVGLLEHRILVQHCGDCVLMPCRVQRDVVVVGDGGPSGVSGGSVVPAWVYLCVMNLESEHATEIPDESWSTYMARTGQVSTPVAAALTPTARTHNHLNACSLISR
jgi:hypothetical protein